MRGLNNIGDSFRRMSQRFRGENRAERNGPPPNGQQPQMAQQGNVGGPIPPARLGGVAPLPNQGQGRPNAASSEVPPPPFLSIRPGEAPPSFHSNGSNLEIQSEHHSSYPPSFRSEVRDGEEVSLGGNFNPVPLGTEHGAPNAQPGPRQVRDAETGRWLHPGNNDAQSQAGEIHTRSSSESSRPPTVGEQASPHPPVPGGDAPPPPAPEGGISGPRPNTIPALGRSAFTENFD
jgi:hypothetical protein